MPRWEGRAQEKPKRHLPPPPHSEQFGLLWEQTAQIFGSACARRCLAARLCSAQELPPAHAQGLVPCGVLGLGPAQTLFPARCFPLVVAGCPAAPAHVISRKLRCPKEAKLGTVGRGGERERHCQAAELCLSSSIYPNKAPGCQHSPSRMASGRARYTRKLRNWIVEQVESGKFSGVCWEDADKTMFRIPWKHAGKQDFREEQDAALFKAWAIFKGKYREGDQADPAAWKTRLRCALNKSSEFEEVPEQGHMEGSEPYKVYRLLPAGTLPDPSLTPSPVPEPCGASTTPQRTQKLQPKRNHSLLSSEEEDNVENKRSCILSEPSLQNSCEIMIKSEGPSSSFQPMDDSGIGSNSSSPESHEDDPEMLQFLPLSDADYSLLLTFHYSGHLVGKTEVNSPDFRLVAKSSGSQSTMEQVVLPSASVLSEPTLQVSTEHLLNLFDRGILVASNARGLFVQRLCTIPISWTGPCTPSGPGPHLLQDKICVEVFNPTKFFQDLSRYHKGLAPPPEFQVTLNFLDEHCGPGYTHKNLITVQMEQAFARKLQKIGFI